MVVEVVLDADTAITAFDKLHRGRYGFLLESLEGGERWARYSFLATEPRTVFHYLGDQVQRLDDDGEFQHETTATPLNHLAELLRDTTAPEVPGLPRFTGGAVGFWGYDVVRTLESLPGAPGDNGDIPDAVVMMVDTLLVIDHLFHRAIVIANVKLDRDLTDEELDRRILATESRANDWLDRLNATGRLGPLVRPANPATVETTALGAAWLAGRQSGVWPDEQGFSKSWRLDRRFTPQLNAEERSTRLSGWRDAVSRTLSRRSSDGA